MRSSAFRYSGFISYSHAADSRLAAELQHSLQQLAKPYYARRATNVFRDQTDLGATPALWSRIVGALNDSEFFLLLASPRAAQSKWVKRELDHWLTTHAGRAEKLMVLWTDGSLSWDDKRIGFDWSSTDALPRVLDWDPSRTPRSLDRVFTEEPFYLDFRWTRQAALLSLRDPAFLDQVATIACELRGMPKHALIGRDVYEHRRFRKIRAAALGAISLLSVIATAFGIRASIAANEAAARQREAERQRNIAIWQSAALQSTDHALNRTDDDRAALLAREALRLHGLTPSEPWYLVESALQNVLSPRVFAHVLQGHSGAIESVAYSHDGGWIASASAEDDSIRVWDLKNPITPAIVTTARDVVELAFSPDGRWLAWSSVTNPTGTFGPDRPRPPNVSAVWLTDLRAPSRVAKTVVKIERPDTPPGQIQFAFVPDSGLLVTSRGGQIEFWDPERAEKPVRASKEGHSLLALTADGRILLTGAGSALAVRRLAGADDAPQELPRSPIQVWFGDITRDGATVAFGGAGHLRLWRPGEADSEDVPLSQPGYVNSVRFSPDGRHFAAGVGAAVCIWDVQHMDRAPRTLVGHKDDVRAVAFSPDGRRLASAGKDKTTRVWEIASALADTEESDRLGGRRVVPPSWDEPVYSVAFAPDGRHFAAAGAFKNPTIKANVPVMDIFNLDAPPLRLGSGADAGFVSFSATGALIALSRSDGGIEVWNTRDTKSPVAVLQGSLATFGPDDHLLAVVQNERLLTVWDVRSTSSPKLTFTSPTTIAHLAYSRDGRRIAIAGDDATITVWQLDGRGSPLGLRGHRDRITSVAISFDGARVAAGAGDGSLRLWDLQDPTSQPLALSGNQSPVATISFSASGDRLAAGSGDSFVRLWDLTKPNAPPIVLSGHRSTVHGVALSPDGRWLVSGGEDTTVRLWPLWQSAADALCARVWRNLSREEWSVYIGEGIPYQATCSDLPVETGRSTSVVQSDR